MKKGKKIRQKAISLLIGMFTCFFLDQVSKSVVRAFLSHDQAITVAPFLTLVDAWNPGISFGLFPCYSFPSRFFLIIITLSFIALLIFWYWTASTSLQRTGLILILGGAISNAWDRLYFHAVFDFLRFHCGSWYFPAFNLADMLITMGFLALMSDYFFHKDS